MYFANVEISSSSFRDDGKDCLFIIGVVISLGSGLKFRLIIVLF